MDEITVTVIDNPILISIFIVFAVCILVLLAMAVYFAADSMCQRVKRNRRMKEKPPEYRCSICENRQRCGENREGAIPYPCCCFVPLGKCEETNNER